MQIKVMIDDGGYMPTKVHDSDAGFDLRTPEDVVVRKGESAVIDTCVRMLIPDGYVGFLKSKSGLNVNCGILSEGVIDAGYTGHIVVKLYNHGDETRVFEKGDKITQIVILPIPQIELETVNEFPTTERGGNGFGSTGK